MKLIVLKNNVPINEVRVETLDLSEQYEIFFGRAEDCHVMIDDPLISRHHLVLRPEGLLWFCEKLSKLGTASVNGVVADKLPIKNGDEIKFGAYSVLVSEIPVPEAPKPAAMVQGPVLPKFEEISRPGPVLEEVLAPTVEEPLKVEDLTANDPQDLDLSDELSSSSDVNDLEDSFNQESGDFLANDSLPVATQDDAGPFTGEGDLVSSEENSLVDSEASSDGTKTKFDLFFVNYMLRLFGEHAPYDRYNLTDEETFIGRDSKKCQITLDDPEVSSVHAVLRKVKNQVVLEDLNSSNGTILNGERINKAQVVPGDEFVIGGTSFSFEVKSELLSNEQDRLLPVEKNQVIEREEILEEEVPLEEGDFGPVAEEKSFIKKLLKEPKRAAIYGVAAVGLLFVLFSSDEEVQVPEKKPLPKTTTQTSEKAKLKLSAELENRRNVAYELGVSFFEQNKYFEALKEFQTVAEIDPSYKKNQTYLEQTKIGLKRIEELEAQKREEEERVKLKKQVEEILVKARAAVKEHQVQLAETYFSQITEKDPENIEVQQLKLELESWVKEEQRVALEKAAKEAARKAMVDALNPGKTAYLKKEWYLSILKLEDFLRRKGTDEDLLKEASDMLSDAKNQLASELGPMLGKARSLKEGQDLKNAYEAFLEVLKVEPTNTEALGEVDDIRGQLDARSKKVYREAIIAESLSLFSDAKEKFQEVQQVSPTDSEYYRKATEKLKNYLE